MFYYLTSWLCINEKKHSTSLCPSEHFTIPTQYLFLTIYPSANTCYGTTTSTEVTTTSTLESPHVKQTDFPTTIKYLLANFYDNFEESIKETISYQDAKFDAKFEKHIKILSLHTKENSTKFSLKLYYQDNKISYFTTLYN